MTTRFVTLLLAALAALAGLCAPAHAQDGERKALRVCQDPSNLPFSNLAGEGIENKLAELFGRALGLPVTYYAFPARMNFIRNTLRYKLPGEDFRCDIVMGVPVGFEQVSVTRPYYRSTYALVYAKGRGLDGVRSTQDFLGLGPERLKKLRIGIHDRSPASEWLNKHQLVDQGVPYKMLDANPAQYPGELLEKELADGKIDVAIVWGPIAGFFAKRVTLAAPRGGADAVRTRRAFRLRDGDGCPPRRARMEAADRTGHRVAPTRDPGHPDRLRGAAGR